MIYVKGEWLSATEGLVQLALETRGSHKIYRVRCDSKIHSKCRMEYDMPYKDYLRYLKNNNYNKTYCLYCSRSEKNLGRLNPNTKYHDIDDSFFSTIDSKEKAYLLGWIGSDGHISNNGFVIEINSKDIEILNIIKKIISADTPITSRKTSTTNLSGFAINSKQISSDLCALFNIKFGKKSNTIQFPKIEEKYFNHFIRGYFDGDGSVNSVNNKRKSIQSSIISNSNQMLIKIKEIVGTGFITGTHFEMSKKSSLSFYDFIYKDAYNLKLERKYNRFVEWIEYYNNKGSK